MLTIHYDMLANHISSVWTVPIGVFVKKVVDIGGKKISLQGGPRWYVEGLKTAPGWGLRVNVTLLFPK